MRYKNFYSELGKLLYAVADIDRVVSPEEKQEMLNIVKNELVPAETHVDKYGTNTAYYTEMEFDYLETGPNDSETAFQSFIDFVEEHHTAIDEKKRDVCIRIANKLAEAYEGKSLRERELIARLTQKLHQIRFVKPKQDE